MQVTVAAAGSSSRIYGIDEQLIIAFVGTLEALVMIASHVIDRVQHTVLASSLVALPASPDWPGTAALAAVMGADFMQPARMAPLAIIR
jgi:aspartate/methionine/tyrosine aminotransferase